MEKQSKLPTKRNGEGSIEPLCIELCLKGGAWCCVFSMLGESWMGLNDAETEAVWVWEGTDLPYDWSPNPPGNTNSDDYVKIKNDFTWDSKSDENRYVICQNISGTGMDCYIQFQHCCHMLFRKMNC